MEGMEKGRKGEGEGEEGRQGRREGVFYYSLRSMSCLQVYDIFSAQQITITSP